MVQAVAFKMGKLYPELVSGKAFDLAYTIEENHWKDKVYLQLNVKDVKFSWRVFPLPEGLLVSVIFVALQNYFNL